MSLTGKQIAIIGAGVVGASTALQLARRGHAVELIDPRGICGGTSFGNAGGVHIGAIQPMASPGIVWSATKMLLDPVGPLMLDWRYLHRSAPWLLRFLLHSTDTAMRAGAAATAAINHRAAAAWQEISTLADGSAHLHRTGWLKVYDRESDFAGGAIERALMREHGFAYQVLDGPALRELEPALSPALLRGVWQPDSLFIDNPGRMVNRIAEAALAAGARFTRHEVHELRPQPGGVRLLTSGGERLFERVVVAAGAWSERFTRPLGFRVPLDTERGYHLMLPHPAKRFARPVMYARRRCVLCPMQEGVRLTACVELAGLERGPDYRRIEKLLPFAARLVPGLETRIESRWLGYRPSLPDGKPVIDAVANGRVLLAFGHGHLGMTQGPATAEAVCALLEGTAPPFPLAPFRVTRFGRA
jgi:D-amino-acid dehydrogenase